MKMGWFAFAAAITAATVWTFVYRMLEYPFAGKLPQMSELGSKRTLKIPLMGMGALWTMRNLASCVTHLSTPDCWNKRRRTTDFT